MSKMSEMYLDIQLLIEDGKPLEYIAETLGIPLDWVESVYESIVEFELGEGYEY